MGIPSTPNIVHDANIMTKPMNDNHNTLWRAAFETGAMGVLGTVGVGVGISEKRRLNRDNFGFTAGLDMSIAVRMQVQNTKFDNNIQLYFYIFVLS